MSAKKLYERLVGKLYAHWASPYPMQEWVDPEGAVDRIVTELLAARGERERCAKIADAAFITDASVRPLYVAGYNRACADITAAIRRGE